MSASLCMGFLETNPGVGFCEGFPYPEKLRNTWPWFKGALETFEIIMCKIMSKYTLFWATAFTRLSEGIMRPLEGYSPVVE